MSIIQTDGDLKRTKRQKRGELALFVERHPSSPALQHQLAWFLDFKICTGTYTLRFCGSPAYRLSSNYTTACPVSLGPKWQIVGPLGLHNHMSQFLFYLYKYNVLYILLVYYIYILYYYIFYIIYAYYWLYILYIYTIDCVSL